MILVNVLFAAVVLAVGFAAGAWSAGGRRRVDDQRQSELETQRQLDIERTAMATDRLRDLAANVASDVGEHNANIGKIEADLAAAKEGDSEAGVLRALAEIGRANEQLQQKLSQAEEQIEAQAAEIKAHESDARTDSLTDLANRRAFDDEVVRRFSELQRQGTPFSLLILDVDHFKKFNDTHGHQAGDEVLRKVAETLKDCARDMDLPCRYGGEEFAIVMPTTEGPQGGVLAERVRTAIEALTVRFEGKELNVTVSLGLAQANSHEDPEALIKRADMALYESKDAGRNNGHLHDEDDGCIPIVEAMERAKDLEAGHKPQVAQTVLLDSLPNRTKFLEQLRATVSEVQEQGGDLTILTAELSGYKRLKKQYGETITKLTMDSVAQFLDNALRTEDTLGKLEEGRFVVLMPGIVLDEAKSIGFRLSRALSECKVPLGDETFQLHTMMSVVEMSDDDTAVSFVKRAEAELNSSTANKAAPAFA